MLGMRAASGMALSVALAWAGCSAGDGGAGPGVQGNGGSAATAGTSGGGAGASGAGASSAGSSGASNGGDGGNGGSIVDASIPDVVFKYDAEEPADVTCAQTSVEGKLEIAPADVIFVVDTSGSMDQEAQWTQQQMPNLVNSITGSGIDIHLILIASSSMCVPAPVGSGACGGGDTKLPNYLHVVDNVGSNNALNKIINNFPQYKSMLRPNAVKSFVVVSDDDADDGPNDSAAAFTNSVNNLDPTLIQPNTWKFHGIVASGGPFSPPCGPFPPLSAAEGKVYKDLINQTGGVFGDLCQQNFGPVFTAIATSVVSSAPLACEITMPTPEAGVIDPNQVKLEITLPPNPPQLVGNVGSAAGCGNGGWYFDNPVSPTEIVLCPETCNVAQASSNPKVNVLLGCLGS